VEEEEEGGWGQEQGEEQGWAMLLLPAPVAVKEKREEARMERGGVWWRMRGRKGGRNGCWVRGCLSVRVI
jgi:hypothetical protein